MPLPRWIPLPFLLLAGLALPAAAEPAATDEWELTFTPYLWMAGLEGRLSAGSTTADVDVSFSDIWADLDVAFLGYFEARKGRWSHSSNLVYLELDSEGSRPFGPLIPVAPAGSLDVDVETTQLVFEQRVLYEVLSLPWAADERRVRLELGGALRVWWLETDVRVTARPGVPVGPFRRSFEQDTDWVDFVAAARIRADLLDDLSLTIAGDYGGFDIGSGAHKTWALSGLLQYRLGPRWDLVGGYRWIDLDRGNADIQMAGPILGFGYRF